MFTSLSRLSRVVFVLILALFMLLLLFHSHEGHGAIIDRTSAGNGTLFAQIESALSHGDTESALQLMRKNSEALARVDSARLHAAEGRVQLLANRFGAAKIKLQLAIAERGETSEPNWYRLLGFALGRLGEYSACRTSFEKGGDPLEFSSVEAVTFSQCLNALGDGEAAWRLLESAKAASNDDRAKIGMAKTNLLMGRQLYLRARDLYLHLTRTGLFSTEQLVDGARKFRLERRCEEAYQLLEFAMLQRQSVEALQERARCQLSLLDYRGAAESLAELSIVDEKYIEESAELFKQAGALSSALLFNERLADSAAKIRQRFGLLLDMRDFEGALALMPLLNRWRLLDQEEVRYGVAYAHFENGEMELMNGILDTLKRPDLVKKGGELRKRAQVGQRLATLKGEVK